MRDCRVARASPTSESEVTPPAVGATRWPVALANATERAALMAVPSRPCAQSATGHRPYGRGVDRSGGEGSRDLESCLQRVLNIADIDDGGRPGVTQRTSCWSGNEILRRPAVYFIPVDTTTPLAARRLRLRSGRNVNRVGARCRRLRHRVRAYAGPRPQRAPALRPRPSPRGGTAGFAAGRWTAGCRAARGNIFKSFLTADPAMGALPYAFPKQHGSLWRKA